MVVAKFMADSGSSDFVQGVATVLCPIGAALFLVKAVVDGLLRAANRLAPRSSVPPGSE
jgi:hypothetical protein